MFPAASVATTLYCVVASCGRVADISYAPVEVAVPFPSASHVEEKAVTFASISVVPDILSVSLLTIEPLVVLMTTVGAIESCVTATLPELEFPALSVTITSRRFTAFC